MDYLSRRHVPEVPAKFLEPQMALRLRLQLTMEAFSSPTVYSALLPS